MEKKSIKNTASDKDIEIKLSEIEIKELKKAARQVIVPRVQDWAKIMGLSYGRITIRGQKTRWGSCSSKRNLNFNYLLVLCPESVIDYVVVHELCHLIHMNHSILFWQELAKFYPQYRKERTWLREHGGELIKKLP